MNSRRSSPQLPHELSLDGDITSADDARAEVATDFGHIVCDRPAAVFRPRSARDVATIVQFAADNGVPIAARGMGHSTFGQAQVVNGIVIDMRSLDAIDRVEHDLVTVGAGATWRSVLDATLPYGLTPPVLTDYLGLSVGGTLSVGGIGGASHRYGAQADQVMSLQVVTGDGSTHTCSREREPDLYHAVLAGLGQHGVITRATLRLVPAPTHVRRYQLRYPSAAILAAQQRILLYERRFDYLQGEILPGDDGWCYTLKAASYYTAPAVPDDERLLHGLMDDRDAAQVDDLTYVAFADRLAVGEAYLRGTGEWLQPHPWWNALVPGDVADEFLHRLATNLTVADIGASGLILTYPIFTAPFNAPLLRIPDTAVVFLVAILRTVPDDTSAVRQAIADNRSWYERARTVGATGYQIGTIPFSHDDWVEHFGPQWSTFTAAKQRYDPHNILCPGQRIFP